MNMGEFVIIMSVALLLAWFTSMGLWIRKSIQRPTAIPVESRREQLALTQAEIDILQDAGACATCGGYHASHCPYVSSRTVEGETTVYHERFTERIDSIIFDSDLREAKLWIEAHTEVPE